MSSQREVAGVERSVVQYGGHNAIVPRSFRVPPRAGGPWLCGRARTHGRWLVEIARLGNADTTRTRAGTTRTHRQSTPCHEPYFLWNCAREASRNLPSGGPPKISARCDRSFPRQTRVVPAFARVCPRCSSSGTTPARSPARTPPRQSPDAATTIPGARHAKHSTTAPFKYPVSGIVNTSG